MSALNNCAEIKHNVAKQTINIMFFLFSDKSAVIEMRMGGEHQSLVSSLVRCSRPDLVLVSSEGKRISTWGILLAIKSPAMADLLISCSSPQSGLLAISVPLPFFLLEQLMAHMETGEQEEQGSEALLGLFGESVEDDIDSLEHGDNDKSKIPPNLGKEQECMQLSEENDFLMENQIATKEAKKEQNVNTSTSLQGLEALLGLFGESIGYDIGSLGLQYIEC